MGDRDQPLVDVTGRPGEAVRDGVCQRPGGDPAVSTSSMSVAMVCRGSVGSRLADLGGYGNRFLVRGCRTGDPRAVRQPPKTQEADPLTSGKLRPPPGTWSAWSCSSTLGRSVL